MSNKKINSSIYYKDFIELLKIEGINEKFRSELSKSDGIFAAIMKSLHTLDNENYINHSYTVLRLSFDLLKNKNDLNISEQDKINLFYASLIHDIDKTTNKQILDLCVPQDRSLLKEIHGFGSASYIQNYLRTLTIISKSGRKLRKSEINKICGLLTFHYLNKIDSKFFNGKISRKDLFLCLVLWLADNADAYDDRTLCLAIPDNQLNQKQKARSTIKKIFIKNKLIIWKLERVPDTETLTVLKKACHLTNEEIAKNRALLLAYDLPTKIVIIRKTKEPPENEAIISGKEIFQTGLSNNAKLANDSFIIHISENSLKKAYEQIRHIFSEIYVKDQPDYNNYVGPLVVEIKNVNGEEKEFTIFNENQPTIAQLKDYAEKFLQSDKKASKDFYFGYTHGQRIKICTYPRDAGDLKKGETYLDWESFISQFEPVIESLKSLKEDARRAYVVIANPLYDHPKSKWRIDYEKVKKEKDYVGPAMLAIHFRIEHGNKISAFSFLRSQEMSTFFLVNYFELKILLEEITIELNRRLKRRGRNKFIVGRIVMLSSLAYFDTKTVLLNKPKIALNDYSILRPILKNLNIASERRNFIRMLEEIRDKSFLVLDYKWCESIIEDNDSHKFLPNNILRKIKTVKRAFLEMQEKVENEQLSRTSRSIIIRKKRVINNLIKELENEYR